MTSVAPMVEMIKREAQYFRLSDLKSEELRLLCYIVYSGDADPQSLSTNLKLSSDECSSIVDRLYHLELMCGKKDINPTHFLDISDFIVVEHPEVLAEIRAVCRKQNTIYEYLWRLADLLRNEDFERASRLTVPYIGWGHDKLVLCPYLADRIENDVRYSKLIASELTDICANIEKNLHKTGAVMSSSQLNIVKNLLTKKGIPDLQESLDRLGLYDYLFNGTSANIRITTRWGKYLKAIKELYKENIEDSLAIFKETLRGKGAKIECPESPLVCFFIAVCLIRYSAKYGFPSVSQLIIDLKNSSEIKLNNYNYPTSVLLEYASIRTSDDLSSLGKRQGWISCYAGNSFTDSMLFLLAKFLKWGKAEIDKLSENISSVAFLRHELEPLIQLPTEEKEKLNLCYGENQLLTSVKIKSSADVLLEEIGVKINRAIDLRPRRVIYFLKGKTLSCIMEQAQNSDNQWVDTQLLSIKKFCREGYESMNLADTRIAMQLATKESWQDDASIIIPKMVETAERLFVGEEYDNPRLHANITNEEPFIEFSGHGEEISVSSNVRQLPDGTVCKSTVVTNGNSYRLITLNPVQADILTQLLEVKSFPISSIPGVIKFIKNVKGIIEVRENNITNSLDSMLESEGILVFRIEPGKLDYKVTLLGAPMRDGTIRTLPAKGESVVYDTDINGITRLVHRNLDKEQLNYEAFEDFATQYNIIYLDYNTLEVNSEEKLLALLEFCHNNMQNYLIEWPFGNSLKFKGILKAEDLEIDIKSGVDWFQVIGKATKGGLEISLDKLLETYCNRSLGEFVQINENEYIKMTGTLRRHLAELAAILQQREKKAKGVPKFQIGALAASIDGLRQNTDTGYRRLMDKIKAADATEILIPDSLNATLRPYQILGYQWMSRLDLWGAGACLADDMGLGKTIQSIAFMLSKGVEGPSLVVAPKSVILNWEDELKRFAPTLTPVILNKCNDRRKIIDEANANEIIICTYGLLASQAELLSSRQWNVVCLDEAQHIKNRVTMTSRAAMDLNAKSRIALTGTPLQNNIGELWNIMQFINPGLLGPWSVFRDTYVNNELDEEHRRILQEMTRPFILRRTKDDVLDELPEKDENIHFVELTEKESRVYEAMRYMAHEAFNGKKRKNIDEEERKKMTYFGELTKLRLAACDMSLVHSQWSESGSKVTIFLALIDNILKVPINNIIVFSQFTSLLSIIRDKLDDRGLEYFYIDGQTALPSRQESITGFQNGERRMLISSLKAGGLGINLTAANYVVLLDPWWNPAIEHQAIDRAHRLGQKRNVKVIRLISKNTIEEKILKLHEKKMKISDDVLDGTSDSYKLTYEDILDMVSPF